MMTVGPYAKFTVAVLSAALIALVSAMTDGRVLTAEAVQIVIAAATAAAVWNAANTPLWRYGKLMVSVILAVANLLATYVVTPYHHITWGEGVNLLIAALTVVAVYLAGPKVAATRTRQVSNPL